MGEVKLSYTLVFRMRVQTARNGNITYTRLGFESPDLMSDADMIIYQFTATCIPV